MKDIDKHFDRFVDYLEAGTAAPENIPDFDVVCGAIGAPERELDDYLVEHFGLGGADIVRSYRTSTPIPFL